MDTLISNVTVVTMNEKMEILFGAYLGIEEGKISYIDTVAPEASPTTIVDGTGMVCMPGLINCHTHLATTALRSYCDDLAQQEQLEQQLSREDKMDRRSAKAAALLGIAECLRFGITSVSDLYYFPEAVAEAAAESGIKANIALSAYRFIDQNEEFDFDTDEQCQLLRRAVEAWHGYDGGRIRMDAGIYAEYTSNHRLWEGLVGYAAEQNIGLQLHLSQTQEEEDSCLDRTGLTSTQLLSCHGMWNIPATAAGCAFLSSEDMALLGKKKVSAVALPLENAKNGRKIADILSCVKSGINVALGTGGAIECGNLDMFEVLRGTAMAVRSACQDADSFPASAPLMMATICGARAQGRAGETGMIKLGYDADLCLLDFSAPHLMPCHNVLSALTFCAKGGDVAMTMVKGKILYQNGQFPTIDLKAVVEELTTYAIPLLLSDDKEGAHG